MSKRFKGNYDDFAQKKKPLNLKVSEQKFKLKERPLKIRGWN